MNLSMQFVTQKACDITVFTRFIRNRLLIKCGFNSFVEVIFNQLIAIILFLKYFANETLLIPLFLYYTILC